MGNGIVKEPVQMLSTMPKRDLLALSAAYKQRRVHKELEKNQLECEIFNLKRSREGVEAEIERRK